MAQPRLWDLQLKFKLNNIIKPTLLLRVKNRRFFSGSRKFLICPLACSPRHPPDTVLPGNFQILNGVSLRQLLLLAPLSWGLALRGPLDTISSVISWRGQSSRSPAQWAGVPEAEQQIVATHLLAEPAAVERRACATSLCRQGSWWGLSTSLLTTAGELHLPDTLAPTLGPFSWPIHFAPFRLTSVYSFYLVFSIRYCGRGPLTLTYFY